MGGRLLPLCQHSSTTKFGPPYEKNFNNCGVSTLMFQGRRQLIAVFAIRCISKSTRKLISVCAIMSTEVGCIHSIIYGKLYMYETSGSCFGDSPDIPTRYSTSKFILSILGHYQLNVSFSSGTFPGVHMGGRLLPLCQHSSTTKFGPPYEKNFNNCGVGTLMFQGRSQLLAVFAICCISKSTRKLISACAIMTTDMGS